MLTPEEIRRALAYLKHERLRADEDPRAQYETHEWAVGVRDAAASAHASMLEGGVVAIMDRHGQVITGDKLPSIEALEFGFPRDAPYTALYAAPPAPGEGG